MKRRHICLAAVLSLAVSLSSWGVSNSLWAATGSGTSTKSAKAGAKKVGYSGDPARKRGLELGYDLGLKAGKQDKEKDAKPDPAAHDPFKTPEKYYRAEFGSRANFVSAFKSGFVGGYQTAFGKKVKLKPDGSGTSVSSTVVKKPKTAPPTTSSTPSSDAL